MSAVHAMSRSPQVWLVIIAVLYVAVPAYSQASGSRPSSPPLRVLFIGNSYTYYNNMTALVAAFASADLESRPVDSQSQVVGGASLESLWGLSKTRQMIDAGGWDFVVLQEQSSLPIESPERMLKFGRRFDSRIKNVGAKTVLFVTWSRRGQQGTQQWIDSAYAKLTASTGAIVAPVGPAWRIALAGDPKMPLYDLDGHHPSILGSYIAACTFYLVLTETERPCPSLGVAGVGRDDAARGRAAALQAVASSRGDSASAR
jgi:hypothetical protein